MGIRPCRRGPGCESALRSQVLRGTIILRIRQGQQILCLNGEGYKPEKCCCQGRKAKGGYLLIAMGAASGWPTHSPESG